MIEKIQTIFKIPELRKKILFTIAILMLCRIGVHIPLPGINLGALGSFFETSSNTLYGMFDMFTGGAFQKAAIFALGIMPYISASIVIQLLGTVFPTIAKHQKDVEGRKKIIQYTRYGTVFLSMAEGYGVAVFLESINASSGLMIVPDPGFMFKIMTMITLTTGTIMMMWLGEQISNKGIGNGISLIITIGIIARFPNALFEEFFQLSSGNRDIFFEIILWAGMLAAISAVILLTQGSRKILVNHVRKTVKGMAPTGLEQNSNIPLKINLAGVMPIIFAQSIMFVPSTIGQMLPDSLSIFGLNVKELILTTFQYQSISYMVTYVLVIIFFTYFYTAIVFNPEEIANNLKASNGYLPGVAPGKETANYLDFVLSRITLPGSLFLGIIAIMPNIIVNINSGVSYSLASFFGGTGLIIMVGVSLDTLQQIESYLLMNHYDGFLQTGQIEGRRG